MSITPEQARSMISSALMSGEPRAFFDAVSEEHPCAVYLQQLLALRGVPQNPAYHPEGDAFEHTMLVISEAAKVREKAADPLAFMLAALTHDLGKAVSTCLNKKGNWSSVGHENSGVPLISKMLRPLGYDHDTVEYCINMCRLHMRAHTCFHGNAREASTDKMYALSVCPREFVMLVICDARGKGGENKGDEEEAFLLRRLENYEKRNASSED
ncbi:MAG: HD domain-containing protein [Clostridia bacterium]|nr:HD domain-containing protein [Clostridia bacterium]